MDTVAHIVWALSKEEVRHYKLFAQRTNKNKERKDIFLFNELRSKGSDWNEEQFLRKHYGDDSKNAYYRLRNRLAEDIGKSLVSLHASSEELIEALHYLALAKLFFNKQSYDIALYFLKKSERKGDALENLELLNLIYREYLRLSNELPSLNPAEIIEKRKLNAEKQRKLNELEDVLAVANHRLKFSQNYGSKNSSILGMLEAVTSQYADDKSLKQSYTFAYAIYQAVVQTLLTQRNYNGLLEYLIPTYQDFEKRQLFKKKNHDAKLQMLTYIINASYQTGSHQQTIDFAERLNEEMQRFQGIGKAKYEFFYYQALVMVYINLDKDEAIAVLEEALGKPALSNDIMQALFIHFNLALFSFQRKRYQKALGYIAKLYVKEGIKLIDPLLRLRLHNFELILRYELDEFDLLEYRITQIRRDFKDLEQDADDQEWCFFLVLEALALSDFPKEDEKVAMRWQAYLKMAGDSPKNSSNLLDYKKWVRTKLR